MSSSLPGVRRLYRPRFAVDPDSVPQEARLGESCRFPQDLRFEYRSQAGAPSPYLDVFKGDETSAFMEIGVTLKDELCFRFWKSEENVELSLSDWMQIYSQASTFWPEAIERSDPVIDARWRIKRRRRYTPEAD